MKQVLRTQMTDNATDIRADTSAMKQSLKTDIQDVRAETSVMRQEIPEHVPPPVPEQAGCKGLGDETGIEDTDYRQCFSVVLIHNMFRLRYRNKRGLKALENFRYPMHREGAVWLSPPELSYPIDPFLPPLVNTVVLMATPIAVLAMHFFLLVESGGKYLTLI